MSEPVDNEPPVALAPDQAPEAVQEVALAEDQVSIELLPLATLVGLAVSETVGAAADTVTIADCEALPPVPVQLRL